MSNSFDLGLGSGQEGLYYYESTELVNRVPIVVITGDATDEMREECEQLGVSDFLPKPISLEKMRELLDRYLLPGGGALAGAQADYVQ